MQLLSAEFYEREDVVAIARDLIGCIMRVRGRDGELAAGRIVETEAYRHFDDRACHANGFRRTRTNGSMFAPGGTGYVYRCYGIHSLLNVVCNRAGIPDAVLIRAVEPLEGIDIMCRRRGLGLGCLNDLTSGPGKLTQALGVDLSYDGESLLCGRIQIFQDGIKLDSNSLRCAARIGVDYAGEDAKLPWRFYLADNRYVSRL